MIFCGQIFGVMFQIVFEKKLGKCQKINVNYMGFQQNKTK
jgi:hypothetical protein